MIKSLSRVFSVSISILYMHAGLANDPYKVHGSNYSFDRYIGITVFSLGINTKHVYANNVVLTPTIDKASVTGILIPRNPDEALREFEVMLPKKYEEKLNTAIKSRALDSENCQDNPWCTHTVLLSIFDFMVEYWGLEKCSILYKYYADRGVWYPPAIVDSIFELYKMKARGQSIDYGRAVVSASDIQRDMSITLKPICN